MIYPPCIQLSPGQQYTVSVQENVPWFGSNLLLAKESDIVTALQQAGIPVVSVKRSLLTLKVDITVSFSCCLNPPLAGDLEASIVSILNNTFSFTNFQALQVSSPGCGEVCSSNCSGNNFKADLKYATIIVVAIAVVLVASSVKDVL